MQINHDLEKTNGQTPELLRAKEAEGSCAGKEVFFLESDPHPTQSVVSS